MSRLTRPDPSTKTPVYCVVDVFDRGDVDGPNGGNWADPKPFRLLVTCAGVLEVLYWISSPVLADNPRMAQVYHHLESKDREAIRKQAATIRVASGDPVAESPHGR